MRRETKVGKEMMDNDRIDQIIDKHKGSSSSLIQILLEIQKEHRWLPREALEKVSRRLQVPLNRIRHIVTFYKAFSLAPKGRHEIHVCMGTACHVRGAKKVLDPLEDEFCIKDGETTPDLTMTLETVGCVGCCGLAPVATVNEDVVGDITKKKLKDLIHYIKED